MSKMSTGNEPAGQEEQAPDAGEVRLLAGITIARDDADTLIAFYDRIDREYRLMADDRKTLALAIAALTEGEKKTRRVEGNTRRAKVEMPSDSYDQKQLKHVWETCPKLRERCLKIGTIDLKKREWDKLEGTKGPTSLMAFVSMIRRANKGPTGTPRITVEK